MGQAASGRDGAGRRNRLIGWVIEVDGRAASQRAQPKPGGGRMLDSGRRWTVSAGVPDRSGACLVDPAVVLRTVVLMLVAYLAGSIPVGVVVARLTGGVDPRTVGSGRTGGTNALRALGRGRAVLVVG